MSDTDFRKLSKEMSGREGARNTLILFVVIVLLASLGAWAYYTELDNVTRGEGRVISSIQNQNVQAAEGGVIQNRYISENDHVRQGDILFEIDPIDASSELNRTEKRYAALRIKEIRLRAEIANEEPVIPDELRARAPEVAASETSLYQARRGELAGALNILQQRLLQREQNLANAQVSIRTAEQTNSLISREIDVMQPLVDQDIAPETRLLALRRDLTSNEGALASAETEVAQARSAISEIEGEIENRREEYLLSSLSELSTVVAEMGEIEQLLPSLRERVGRTTIRAPVDGIVNRLNFRTAGGYVNQGDVVAELVPTGDELIIEARIAPQDISDIRLQDEVRIRFSAYDSTRYGTVDGRVTQISPDAIRDEDTGESHYLVDVAIEGDLEIEGGQKVEFIPGMTATVDVLSGKRTVMQYLWEPVARVQELALRD